ncbi:Holliday junction resolvase RuvX [Blastopirellula marina]|uniref:Putative pre-16S rRNA nuclease n=1 Tax=Blastopirellula marina TaxID=124 RepID=A0A2S8F8C4_9BACT|nr:Holliday junction resolvase RuvX [Blastopirellula marina]PQO28184.1 Holliday junction resolvase RuvX [Blastopirellula marina]PTL41724.1 Holliday junction resolvase RuvX [Blastopirellula marina]
MSNQLPSIPEKGRIAAIDYGTVRIGVAITDPDRILCSPLENYNRRSLSKDAQYFRELAELERVVLFVVGLPVHLSGDESQKSHEARQFGKWLFETTSVPVTFYDERFTTSMAKDLLQEAGLTKKRRKARLDMLSAQILLTAFLENPDRSLGSIASLED